MAKKANLDSAEKLDITVRRGDSFELLLNMKDNTGVAIPLESNDYRFFIQIQSVIPARANTAGAQPRKVLIAGSTLDQTRSTKSAASPAKQSIFFFTERDDLGNIKLRANAVDTSNLPTGNYLYEIQYSYDDNGFERVKTILRGNFIIREDIATAL